MDAACVSNASSGGFGLLQVKICICDFISLTSPVLLPLPSTQSLLSMIANPRVRQFDCMRLALLFQLRYGKQSPELQEVRKALSGGARNLGDKGKQVRAGRGGGRE